MTNRNKPRPLTMLELTLLGLAAQKPRSGYDFKSLFESTALRQFSSSPGSIYPALKRLEAAGFLGSQLRESGGDRTRRVYSVTLSGRTELRSWLEAEVTVEELRQDLRLPILRFSLFGSIGVSGGYAARFLDQLAAAAREYGQELERTAQALAGLDDPYPGLALEHGRASLRVLGEWSRRPLTTLMIEVQ